MKWYQSTKDVLFHEMKIEKTAKKSAHKIIISDTKKQYIKGFGGCVNELGMIALEKLSETQKHDVLRNLFGDRGTNFSVCRIPIGASDYAQKWYSHNEVEDDFEMEHFNIERDRKYLIPFIKEAQKHHEEPLFFFASPWSPPTWMKNPPVYNYGRIKMDSKTLHAYALYLKKFIEHYQQEGILVSQLHLQNEPFADQKFPSCLWDAESFRIFIKDYIGPLFKKENMKTELFLGTLNGPEEMNFSQNNIKVDLYNKYVDSILFDEDAIQYIKGIGYQWAGRGVVAKTNECFPELELIQTENECGDGSNSWEYAQYIFNLVRHYFASGVTAYTYWNMILEEGGESSWGWKQNALITINKEQNRVVYNPEYYVMLHYSHFLHDGAVLLKTSGNWNSVTTAYENSDGSRVVIMQNALDRHEKVTIVNHGEEITLVLEPNSFHTFVFE